MILYTPLPLELVFDGGEIPFAPYQEATLGDCTVIVQSLGDGRYKLIKLLSTNPQDFLNPNLQPGVILGSIIAD